MEKTQGEREPHLGEKEEVTLGASRGKSQLHSEGRRVPLKTERASKENLCNRKHKQVSGCKSSPGESGVSWFLPKYGHGQT